MDAPAEIVEEFRDRTAVVGKNVGMKPFVKLVDDQIALVDADLIAVELGFLLRAAYSMNTGKSADHIVGHRSLCAVGG